jgi:hypothetical protein
LGLRLHSFSPFSWNKFRLSPSEAAESPALSYAASDPPKAKAETGVCPLLLRCGKFGMDCRGRDFNECDFFKTLLREKRKKPVKEKRQKWW